MASFSSSVGSVGDPSLSAVALGNKENHESGSMSASPWLNMGDVSKLSATSGESKTDGDVKLVKAVDGGAEPGASGSRMRSLGDTVPGWCEPDDAVDALTLVKCDDARFGSNKGASVAKGSSYVDDRSNKP